MSDEAIRHYLMARKTGPREFRAFYVKVEDPEFGDELTWCGEDAAGLRAATAVCAAEESSNRKVTIMWRSIVMVPLEEL